MLVQGATDDFQFPLAGEGEEAAGQRSDADIGIAGHRGGGDGLSGFEEMELHRHTGCGEPSAILRDVEWRRGGGAQQAEADGGRGACDAGQRSGGKREGAAAGEVHGRSPVKGMPYSASISVLCWPLRGAGLKAASVLGRAPGVRGMRSSPRPGC